MFQTTRSSSGPSQRMKCNPKKDTAMEHPIIFSTSPGGASITISISIGK